MASSSRQRQVITSGTTGTLQAPVATNTVDISNATPQTVNSIMPTTGVTSVLQTPSPVYNLYNSDDLSMPDSSQPTSLAGLFSNGTPQQPIASPSGYVSPVGPTTGYATAPTTDVIQRTASTNTRNRGVTPQQATAGSVMGSSGSFITAAGPDTGYATVGPFQPTGAQAPAAAQASIIPGVSNTMLLLGAAGLLFVLLSGKNKIKIL